MDFIEKCLEVRADPYKEVAYWKKELNRQVIGWSPMYAPEELIHAAGCLPVYLHGFHETVSEGSSQLQSYFCPPIRSMVNSVLKNNYGYVDGILLVGTCDEAEHVAQILEVKSAIDWVHMLRIPFALYKKVCQEKLLSEMIKFKLNLEAFTGKQINDEALQKSIVIYNKTRSLLRNLFKLRIENPGILTNKEICAIVFASMFMPKEKYNEQLETFISDLKVKKETTYRAKVVLMGSICDDPGEDVLEGIEEIGLAVVYDDMFIGGHYFSSSIKENGDPLEEITKKYWEGAPTPCKLQQENRTYAEHIVELVKKSNAQGIINFEWKFCEYQSYAWPYLEEVFEREGIPYLRVDVAEETMAKESIKTRYEAFAEIIERLGK